MRVLAASVCRQAPDVLHAFLESLRWQRLKGLELDIAIVNDNDDPASQQLIANRPLILLEALPKPEGAEYAVSDVTHHWTLPMFGWLAREKQRLIEYARDRHYDGLWLIDSDLVCSPDTLSSLWHTQKPVVSAVFWTKWTPDSPALPQVWLQHPYELQGAGMEAHEFLGLLENRELVRVGGLGACTLIRANVLDRVGFWPLIDGLPNHGMWQGEDRHFCVRAARNHVELWADAWPDVFHVYRPEDRAAIAAWRDRLSRDDRVDYAVAGDLVSFSIEALEEPRINGHITHVRGRLGAIHLLPEIEESLGSMRPGEELILKVGFPRWYEIAEYRGRAKLVRIKLHHIKPNAPHPTLDTRSGAIAHHFLEAV